MRLCGQTALVLACAGIFAQASLAQNESVYTPPPVEAFARLPLVKTAKVAPGGKHVAAFIEKDGRYVLTVLERPVSGGGWTPIFGAQETDETKTNWAEWASAEYLLLSIRQAAVRYGVPTTEKRLYRLRPDGSDMKSVIRQSRDEIPIQIQDEVVDFLPNDPDHILMQYNAEDPRDPIVYRVNIEKRTDRAVQRSRYGVLDWMTDTHGQVRVGWGVSRDDKPVLHIRRTDGEWARYDERIASDALTFQPLGFGPDPALLYVASNHEGDPAGLYLFNVDQNAFVDRVFQHPVYDVAGLSYNYDGSIPEGVYFGDSSYFWSESAKSETLALSNALPGELRIMDESADGRFAIVRQEPQGAPGKLYLIDRAGKNLDYITPQYPELEAVALGPVIETAYTARDGLVIPAFVTLPPWVASLDEAQNLPFIVHPHGGPNARDFARFDYWTQFFASRGYGVLQMNFRGSTGYGAQFQTAGDREWGQAMQDDITDGAYWLIAQGYGDPNRIAIVGASYGGYAALMGAAKTPDLYACAVSFAGVTDLRQLVRASKDYIAGKYLTRHIGRLWKDRRMLAENSPTERAKDIRIPVLLVHGEDDRVVDEDHGRDMARALRRAGVPHKYVKLDKGGHFLSEGRNRLTLFREMEAFLAGCMN